MAFEGDVLPLRLSLLICKMGEKESLPFRAVERIHLCIRGIFLEQLLCRHGNTAVTKAALLALWS